MRVLLVNPWIHDFSAYDLWMKPFGLISLAGVLEENHFELDYIDCLDNRYNVKPDGRAKFAKQSLPTPPPLSGICRKYGRYGIPVERFREKLSTLCTPDAILVTSGMTYWYQGVQETIRELRRSFSTTRIVLGGVYATLMPDHARKYSGADAIVPGQFEKEIVSFLTAEPPVRPYNSIDDYPYPAWRLTGEKRYRILLTSRGCPYRCTFCASDILNGQNFMQRKPEKVFKEIAHYYDHDRIREFVFYDDALLVNHRRHLEPMLQRIIDAGMKAHFHTPNGLNAHEIDETLAGLMFESGFRTIRLSLESANPEIQQKAGYKVTNDSFDRAVKNLCRAGYQPGDLECYLIMGLPNQTPNDVRASLRHVAGLGVIARLATFSPIPGTPEAETARHMIGDDFLKEPLLQNHSSFPLRNASMTETELQSIKDECNLNNSLVRAHGGVPRLQSRGMGVRPILEDRRDSELRSND